MITDITAGMALINAKTPHDPTKELRDRTSEIFYLSTKLNHAKETCVSLDFERQKFREAARCIKTKDIDPVWIYNGTCFLQACQEKSLSILDRDTKTVEDVRDQIKEVIKKDTDTFLKLHKERNLGDRGFDLKPVVKDGKITD